MNLLPEKFRPFWPETVALAELTNNDRIAMFLAHADHESGGFKVLSENLNYSAQGLADTWPERYARNPDTKPRIPNQTAKTLHRDAQAIANLTYANRNGNGSVSSGDGWRYRGHGFGITGRALYAELDKYFNMNGKLLANPDMVAEPYWAMISFAYFWHTRKVNPFADNKNVAGATITINGGTIGLTERKEVYKHYQKQLA